MHPVLQLEFILRHLSLYAFFMASEHPTIFFSLGRYTSQKIPIFFLQIPSGLYIGPVRYVLCITECHNILLILQKTPLNLMMYLKSYGIFFLAHKFLV